MRVTDWRKWYRAKVYAAMVAWFLTFTAIGNAEQTPDMPLIPYPRLFVVSSLVLIGLTISLATSRRE